MLKRFLGICCLLCVLLLPAKSLAATYDVNASVLAPLPPTVPIVTGPAVVEQQNNGIFISGTCTIVVPTLIVVLVRDNQTIGSGNCSSEGRFNVFVGLVLGVNIIYAKFLTVTGQSSGFSEPISITYKEPTSATSQSPSSEPAKQPASALGLLFDYDFVTYDDLKLTQLEYSVSGGTPPYNVVVSWGDGTQKKYQIKTAGIQKISHQYKKILPPSQITILVTDSTGIKMSQSRALVSFRSGVYVPPAIPLDQDAARNWYPVWLTGAVCLSGIVLLVRLQNRHLIRGLPASTRVKASSKKVRKK